jgi:hypothetical protein
VSIQDLCFVFPHIVALMHDMHSVRTATDMANSSINIPCLHLTLLLQPLHLLLPRVPRLPPQHLARLFDTDQTFARVVRVGRVGYIRKDLVCQLFRGLFRVDDLGIGDVEDVCAFEGGFDG